MSLETGCQQAETMAASGHLGGRPRVDLRRSLLVIVCQNDRKVPPILYFWSAMSSKCHTIGNRVRLWFSASRHGALFV